MLRNADRDWGLTIGPDTVRLLALKAKAISADLRDDYVDGGEHEVEFDGDRRDTHQHDGLAEEEAGDLRAAELRDLINDLNEDETAELIALAWIGRGDFDGVEWTEAVAEARQRPKRRAAAYLMSMPMLGDWLEDGLQALGA